MTKIFPFDCIIVTSPDEKSAKLASGFLQRILEKRLNRYYPSQTIRVVSTYDPFGARCGSGGGTLAALEFAHKDETVLVLHAGGDSSRCPTQMILGKAWTSIPCGHHRNPTIWLIDQLQRLHEHAKFPKGVVVVAATDCLATFFEKGQAQIEWNYQYSDESLVLGIAVPAVITTAKNHGVYIMSQEILKNKSLGIEDPLEVWQKPTVEQLRATTEPAPACFDLSRQEEKQAWIDTGIVVFFPKAVETLYELSGGVLSLCTWKGLEAAYQQQKPTDQSLEEFAQSNALKVDLYTDFLHNLSWPKQQPKKKLKEESSPLREILSRLPLKIMVAPQGRFLHLGTTQELVNFVTEGAYPDHSGVIAYISTFFSLQPRYQCWPNPQPLSRNVALQSSFPDKTSIGTSSLVEYSDLASYKSVSIGDNVMLSGWRNPTKDTSPLEIPNNLSVQILSLNESHGTELFAYMVLGMSDGIKTQMKQCTFFGIPILEFLEKTSLSVEQLGWTEGGDEDDTLWTAKVHPKVPAGTSFESTFGWIKELRYGTTRSVTGNASFSKWLSSSRVSLKELHGLANAEAEWTFRTNLESAVLNLQRENFIPHLRSLLKERCHNTPCDLHWMIEMENREAAANELSNLLNVLEEIAREELGKERFDVCGRAFMIASAILADFDSITNQDKDPKVARDIMEYGTVHVNTLRASSTRCVSREEQLRALDNIIEHRKNAMKTDMVDCLAAYSEITERLAFCMNELSIAGGFHKYVDIPNGENITTRKNFSIVKNQWVMAMAPARCDLAGAWSDTPPVCYEYGGSVTGMAVLVDNHMPLSCRCRILPGEKGIHLRTDLRCSDSGSLKTFLDSDITDISHLNDFRDPLSDCALVKSALVCLGMVSEEQILSETELQPLVNKFCSSQEDVRMEIVTTSLLPHGSGMGTSSILGGCILAAIARCVGIGELSDDCLFHAVLMLEQLLSSGGGYQDQAHGIVAGVKTVRSNPAELPLVMSVENLNIDPSILATLNERIILTFTGKTRLAKNILQNVLRRWARRTDEIVAAVERLIFYSEQSRKAVLEGDFKLLGRSLFEMSKLKVIMTGEDSGAQPESVRKLVSDLMDRKIIEGGSLCGAGGGGFMVMIASEGYNVKKVRYLVQKELVQENEDLSSFTFHNCRISDQGLSVHVIEDENVDIESFDLAWQCPESSCDRFK